MDDNYLVAVVSCGKVIELYYSDDLSDIATIRALHHGCDVDVLKIREKVVREEEGVPYIRPYRRPILCVETGEVFENIVDCAKKTGIPKDNIYKSILQHIRAKGYYFEYYKGNERRTK